MKIGEICGLIEDFAPLALQESYDNSGLLVGDNERDINAVLLCIDVTETVVEEAVKMGAGLILSHHPVIFGGLKKLTGTTLTERVVLSAVRSNIALYSAHTNIDNAKGGVSAGIASRIGLKNCEILSPSRGILKKLVVFVPSEHAANVREAMFTAGAGHIGDYDMCSFNLEGEGSFRGGAGTDPFVGQAGSLHFGKEIRIETVFPGFLEKRILKSMLDSHPYEEVAYDIYPLDNSWAGAGAGIFGDFENALDAADFLRKLKKVFGSKVIRHTKLPRSRISRVAVCGGSGSSLIAAALKHRADAYVSADFKYHDFFPENDNMMIADIGHYESEQFALEIFRDLLTKKFPNFAVHISEINTNPIHYY